MRRRETMRAVLLPGLLPGRYSYPAAAVVEDEAAPLGPDEDSTHRTVAVVRGLTRRERHDHPGAAAHVTHDDLDAYVTPDGDCLAVREWAEWSGGEGRPPGEFGWVLDLARSAGLEV
jgi:hypothetical protein